MSTDSHVIELSEDEIREVAGYAAHWAGTVLPVFEAEAPHDARPREAIDAAVAFAEGARRTSALRSCAWAAFRAAQSAGSPAAVEAAHAASAAAAAAFLHPLAQADQVKHILGSAARAARATELDAGGDAAIGDAVAETAARDAPAVVVDVLRRYPEAPGRDGRLGELMRLLDSAMRDPA